NAETAHGDTPLAGLLVALALAFQLKLTERFHDAVVEGVEQAGGPEIVDPRQIAARAEAEVSQELLRRRIEQRPPRALAPAGGTNPARVHQHVERALGYLDPADCLNLGAADRLVIGDNRQRFGRRPRQPARLLAGAAQQMSEIGSGLEMP